MVPTSLGPGTVVGQRFRVVDRGVRGGMATVHRGDDLAAGGPVAIKLVALATPDEHERFAREAAILARLADPTIVRYVAHGRASPTAAYLVTEWIEGPTLADRLASDGLTVVETVDLARQLARGLAAAHALDVVHRDLKPANLLFPQGGAGGIKLIDFGVARAVAADARVTATGVVVGTPGYMAPEQARGVRTVDTRADLFALGCILYECLAGRPAFCGEGRAATLAKILFAEPPSLASACPEAPPGLIALVERLLAKEPALRCGPAAEVAAALAALGPLPDGPRRPTRGPSVATAVRPSGPRLDARLALVIMTTALGGGPSPADLADLVVTPGARLERLDDGALVITMAVAGSPPEQAAHAAQVALRLRAQIPAAVMVIAAGVGADGLAEVLDRAAGTLAMLTLFGDGRPAIHLDELVAALIGRAGVVADTPGGPILTGLRPG